MRPSQRQAYADRIDRVVRYLENREAERGLPSLSELAKVAAMSEYHFHRIFRLMTGETVADAVRRLQLARALPKLATGSALPHAADESGYATPQAFTRAFKQQSGSTPRSALTTEGGLVAVEAKLRLPQQTGDTPALRVEVVSVEPFRLLSVRNVGDYAELDGGFSHLFDLVLAQVSPEALRGIYGVPHDDPRSTPAGKCRFDCALAVGETGVAISELNELFLGGGDHARARHLGDYDQVPASIDALYAFVMDELGREIHDGPLFIHYLDDPEEVPEAELRSDLYLPID
jgi:AraC family transcriptional regulator